MLNVPLNVELQKKMDFTFQEPYPPQSFTWLCGDVLYPVYPEPRGKRVYWYMQKMVSGKYHRVYVAPAGKLTAELLNNAAAQVEANASPVKPKETQ